MKKAMTALALMLVVSLTACTDDTASSSGRSLDGDLFAGRSYEEMLRDGRVTDWDSEWNSSDNGSWNTGSGSTSGSSRGTGGSTVTPGTVWDSTDSGSTGADGFGDW